MSKNHSTSSTPTSWWPLPVEAIWLAIPVSAALFFTLVQAIYPNDYWWPMVQARAAMQLGALPASNLYLYTIPVDAPFINQPWLAQQLMWRLMKAGGHASLVILSALLTCGSFAVSIWVARREGAALKATALLTTVCAVVAANNLTTRTQMFVLLGFVGVLSLVKRAANQGWGRWQVASLGVVSGLWANLHGSCVLVSVMVFGAGLMCALESTWRHQTEQPAQPFGLVQWLVAGAVGAAAALVNPHGWEVYAYVWRLSTAFSKAGAKVTEWMPLTPWSFQGAMVLGVSFGGAVVLWRGRARWFEVALWVGFLVMAISSVRNVVWWSLAQPLILGRHLPPLFDAQEPERPSAAKGVAHLLCVVLLLGGVGCFAPGGPLHLLWGMREAEPDDETLWLGGEGPDALLSVMHPAKTVAGLVRVGQLKKGRVFHEQAIGGYLEYMLAPQAPAQVAFVDQRFSLLPHEVWQEYFKLSESSPGWEAVVNKYDIDVMLVDGFTQYQLCHRLKARPEQWVLVAKESRVRMFVRREEFALWQTYEWPMEDPEGEACPKALQK